MLGTIIHPITLRGAGKFVWDNSFSEWLANWYYLPSIWSQLKSWLWGWVALGLVFVGLLAPIFENLKIKSPWVFHAWAAGFFIDYIFEAEHLNIDSYNMSLANPIAAALAGLGLVLLCRDFMKRLLSQNFRRMIYALVLIGIALPGQIELRKHFENYYGPHHELGKELARISKDNDLVISFGQVPVAIYYSGLHGWLFPPAEVWTSNEYSIKHWIDSPERVVLLESLRKRGARWLVVVYGEHDPESEPILTDYINATYKVVYESASGKIYRAR